MILYQRKTLATNTNIGDPGAVPVALQGWTDEALADVSAAAPDAAAELGYDGEGFFPVEVDDPAPAEQPLQKIDFLRLFTQAERIAIRNAAKVNDQIADYQYVLDNSSVILLSDPDIQAGVPLLEMAGLLGAGRAAQILANEAP